MTRQRSKLPKNERLAINPNDVFIITLWSLAPTETLLWTVWLLAPSSVADTLFIILNSVKQKKIQFISRKVRNKRRFRVGRQICLQYLLFIKLPTALDALRWFAERNSLCICQNEICTEGWYATEVGLNHFAYGHDHILIALFTLRSLRWDKTFLYMSNNGNTAVIGTAWDKLICCRFHPCYPFI